MGMFDSVIFKCPNCSGRVEAQSKAGECYLNNYEPDSVPSRVGTDLDGDTTYCPTCKRDYLILNTTNGLRLALVNFSEKGE